MLVKRKTWLFKTLHAVPRTAAREDDARTTHWSCIFEGGKFCPISSHLARQLVLRTSKLRTGAVKPLDKKNLMTENRYRQSDVRLPPSSHTHISSFPLGKKLRILLWFTCRTQSPWTAVLDGPSRHCRRGGKLAKNRGSQPRRQARRMQLTVPRRCPALTPLRSQAGGEPPTG